MKLYEIPAEYQAIIDATEETEGVLSQEQEHELSRLDGEFADKADNICRLIKNIEADEKSLKDEIARLAAIKRTNVNRVKGLKEYLKSAMQAMGIEKLETPSPMFAPRIQKNPITIRWEGIASDIPFIYRKEPEVSSALVKAAHATGKLIEGEAGGRWEIIQGTHLRLSKAGKKENDKRTT